MLSRHRFKLPSRSLKTFLAPAAPQASRNLTSESSLATSLKSIFNQEKNKKKKKKKGKKESKQWKNFTFWELDDVELVLLQTKNAFPVCKVIIVSFVSGYCHLLFPFNLIF